MRQTIGKLGQDEGKHTGPPAGDGASSVGGMVAGGNDVEGTMPDELPPRPTPANDSDKQAKETRRRGMSGWLAPWV